LSSVWCIVDVVQEGIPHGVACPAAESAHGGGQYLGPDDGGGVLELWPGWLAGGGGGQYPPGGGGGGHIKVWSTARDPPHGITGVEPV
jgi:hypothetical protein